MNTGSPARWRLQRDCLFMGSERSLERLAWPGLPGQAGQGAGRSAEPERSFAGSPVPAALAQAGQVFAKGKGQAKG